MQKFLSLALGATALALTSVLPVSAATINLGTFSDDNTLQFPGFSYAGNAAIDQTYSLTLDETADLSVSITNSFANLSQQISGLTLTFDGTPGTTQTIFFNPPKDTSGFTLAGFGTLSPLSPGTYTFTVAGTAGSGGSVFDGNLALSAVPLPAAAPMFGAALLALGAVGYGVKRKAKTLNSAA